MRLRHAAVALISLAAMGLILLLIRANMYYSLPWQDNVESRLVSMFTSDKETSVKDKSAMTSLIHMVICKWTAAGDILCSNPPPRSIESLISSNHLASLKKAYLICRSHGYPYEQGAQTFMFILARMKVTSELPAWMADCDSALLYMIRNPKESMGPAYGYDYSSISRSISYCLDIDPPPFPRSWASVHSYFEWRSNCTDRARSLGVDIPSENQGVAKELEKMRKPTEQGQSLR